MKSMIDHQDHVKRAISDVALRLFAREITLQDFMQKVAPLADRAKDNRTPREIAAAEHRERREKILEYVETLKQKGRGRDAATKAAGKFARDPGDSVEVQNLARTIRRWRKKTDLVRLPPLKSDTD